MPILIYALSAVYVLAINLYAFLLLKTQKKQRSNGQEHTVSDGKLFMTALLGGALTIYISMFILKYRLKNLFFMVIMPLIITVNIYICIVLFSNDFGLFFLSSLSPVLSKILPLI